MWQRELLVATRYQDVQGNIQLGNESLEAVQISLFGYLQSGKSQAEKNDRDISKKKIPVVDLILKDSNYVSAIYHGD